MKVVRAQKRPEDTNYPICPFLTLSNGLGLQARRFLMTYTRSYVSTVLYR